MKKLTALILSLSLLLLPVLGMAETEYDLYVDPTGSYGFHFPYGWTLLSKETVHDILSDTDELTPETAALIQSVLPQMEQVEMVLLVSPDGSSNINMVREYAGVEITEERMLQQMEYLKVMMPQMLPSFEILADPTAIPMGDNQTVMIGYTYEMEGMSNIAIQALAGGEGGYLYTFTLTMSSTEQAAAEQAEEAFEVILCSAAL